MGCICAKSSSYVLDYADSPKGKGSCSSFQQQRQLQHQHFSDVGKYSERRRAYCSSVKWRTASSPFAKRRRSPTLSPGLNLPDVLPRQLEAEQVAAGWPAWLTAVAGEAIKGWIPRRADSFQKLYKIGQGTYSNVYKARDLENGKLVALKKVRFDSLEPESVRFMAREILILRRLDHPNIVKLEGLVTSGLSCNMYLVFDYMEHDLAGLMANPVITLTEPQIKCFIQQLLQGLDHCHSRGVLHRDIKGSNLLIDNAGILKIADFGLANFFSPGQKQLLTSHVVTLWYRPPELLLGATDYGVSVDLWSSGCILAEMLSGKPILPGKTEVEQLHKIFKLCGSPGDEYWKKCSRGTVFKPLRPYKSCILETFKDFSPPALSLLQTLLSIEPSRRGDAVGALKSEFFTTDPLPCDPSSLPKYPPSKEFDAKLRAEEARRQKTLRKHGVYDSARRSRLCRPDLASNEGAGIIAQRYKLKSHAAGRGSESASVQENGHHDGIQTDAECEKSALEPRDTLTESELYEQSYTAAMSDRNKEKRWMKSGEKMWNHTETSFPKESRDSYHRREDKYTQDHKKVTHSVDRKFHFSGPLLYSSVNIDEMLQKHEQQMRFAVRKARRAKYIK